jgi:hypothetical protein
MLGPARWTPAAATAGLPWCSYAAVKVSQPANSVPMTIKIVTPWRNDRTILPNVYVNATGIIIMRTMDTKFVSPVGFSNGWAPLAANIPPPSLLSCFIASMDADGPRGRIWVTPLRAS